MVGMLCLEWWNLGSYLLCYDFETKRGTNIAPGGKGLTYQCSHIEGSLIYSRPQWSNLEGLLICLTFQWSDLKDSLICLTYQWSNILGLLICWKVVRALVMIGWSGGYVCRIRYSGFFVRQSTRYDWTVWRTVSSRFCWILYPTLFTKFTVQSYLINFWSDDLLTIHCRNVSLYRFLLFILLIF